MKSRYAQWTEAGVYLKKGVQYIIYMLLPTRNRKHSSQPRRQLPRIFVHLALERIERISPATHSQRGKKGDPEDAAARAINASVSRQSPRKISRALARHFHKVEPLMGSSSRAGLSIGWLDRAARS